MDGLLERLDLTDVEVYRITLSASREALTQRIRKAVEQGERTSDVLQRSLDRLPLYQGQKMHTSHIDVSDISPAQAAREIAAMLGDERC